MKRGAMTVPKLVAIILAVVLLVFLVFGARQLQPLYNRVGDMFDSVLYFFNLKEDGTVKGECTPLRILDWNPEGKLFLDNVEVPEGEQEGMSLFSCDDGSCGIDFKKGEFDYRIKSGKLGHFLDSGFGSYSGEDWFDLSDYSFATETELSNEIWKVYNGVFDFIESEVGEDELKRIYFGMITPKFQMNASPSTLVDHYKYLSWEDGKWNFTEKKLKEGGVDADSILNKFFAAATKNINDKVYYTEHYPYDIGKWEVFIPLSLVTKSLDDLSPGLGEKLDESEKQVFIDAVKAKIDGFEKAAAISDADYEKLEKASDGKTVIIDGVDYVLNLVKDSRGRPEIIASSGTKKYWFRFRNSGPVVRIMPDQYGAGLRAYPVTITHNNPDGSFQSKEIDYQLPDYRFEEVYKLNLIEDFIRTKCR